MKTNKSKKKKNKIGNKISVESSGNEIRSFIIIAVIIAVLAAAIYGVTELINKSKNKGAEEEVTSGVINYNKVNVGTLLNRPYNEYYVLAYDSESSDAIYYSVVLTKYLEKASDDNYTKIYYLDLSNKLNASYYNVNNDNKSNPSATKISDLDFGDLTLLKIKKGKIVSYIEDLDKIQDLLK